MTPGASRPRSSHSLSTASNRPRPLSRASTTSINTPTEESTPAYQHVIQPAQIQLDLAAQTAAEGFTPEGTIATSKQQLARPDHGLAVDPSLQYQEPQSRAMSVDSAYNGSNEVSEPNFHTFHSFEGKENHAFPNIDEKKTQIGAVILEAQKKPRGNASSQANDQELRRLYRENRHRNLKDVAISVLANERGPKSEKTKQIFAMNWLEIRVMLFFS